MATNVAPEDIFVSTLSPFVSVLLNWDGNLHTFNTLPDIPWHLREKVRSYESKVANLHQTIVEEFDKLETDAGRAAVEKFWGPLEDE